MNISIFTNPGEEKNKSEIGGDKNSFPLLLTQDQAGNLFSRQDGNGQHTRMERGVVDPWNIRRNWR